MAKPGPTNLWHQAAQEAAIKYKADSQYDLRKAHRVARYNELMIEHGYVIIKEDNA